jgi:hypothetical protein
MSFGFHNRAQTSTLAVPLMIAQTPARVIRELALATAA